MVSDALISQEMRFAQAMGLLPLFQQAARETGVPLEILLAVASRESGMGRAIVGSGWTGDQGYGLGIMQIDWRHHPEYAARYRPGDHVANIRYAARFLRKLYDRFQNWRYALAAYNAGPERIRWALEWAEDPDQYTTRNYAADVLARAERIRMLLNPRPSWAALLPVAAAVLGVGLIAKR